MKILIIQFYRLGDVLQTTPVLQALKKKYKDVSIDFIVDESCAAVVRGNPYISKLFVIPRKSVKKAVQKDFMAGLREISVLFGELAGNKYDLAINYNFEPAGGIILDQCIASDKRGLIYRNGKFIPLDNWTQYLFAIVENRKYSRINISDVFKLIAGCGGLSSSLYLKSRFNDASIRNRFMNFERNVPVIAIQGSGSQQFKSLTASGNSELIRLLSTDFNVILLGARGEEARMSHMKDTANFRNLTAKTSFDEFVAIIKNCSLLISPDTFAIHAAAALKTKVLAYYLAGAMPHETAPYAAGALLIHKFSDSVSYGNSDCCSDKVCSEVISPVLIAETAKSILLTGKTNVSEDGIGILTPQKDDFLFFDDLHKEYINTIMNIINLTGQSKKPIISPEASIREGASILQTAMRHLKEDMLRQTT
jgi:heptosyltransferase-1